MNHFAVNYLTVFRELAIMPAVDDKLVDKQTADPIIEFFLLQSLEEICVKGYKTSINENLSCITYFSIRNKQFSTKFSHFYVGEIYVQSTFIVLIDSNLCDDCVLENCVIYFSL